MKFSTACRKIINETLSPLHLKLETRRAEYAEKDRLAALRSAGYFERPAFPIPICMQNCSIEWIGDLTQEYRQELVQLNGTEHNTVAFRVDNQYYFPPDSDVLYAMIRHFAPAKIIEVGSGNSTRVARQAIDDGCLNTCLVSIDPKPRVEVAGIAHELRTTRVEALSARDIAQELKSGDFFFIDSSHDVAVGNDVVFQFLNVLPLLAAGVVIHIHDVSLPFDYPPHWIDREPVVAAWGEQYLLQAMLAFSESFEVLWPGYYVQQNVGPTKMDEWFPARNGRDATSFWMRKRLEPCLAQ
jgi:hypothetical protein